MFIGSVQCEVELSSSHPAFEGMRFLLVEAEHEVEWEGPVVAIDSVEAQVGDMVVVALAPLGDRLEIPDDLPVEAAVVGIVGSITTPAEDEEEGESEEEPAPRSRSRRPRRSDDDRGERERAPRRQRGDEGESSETRSRSRRPAEEDANEEAPPRKRRNRKSDDEGGAKKRPRRSERPDTEATEKPEREAPAKSRHDRGEAGGGEKAAAASDTSDALDIVWDADDEGDTPSSTKRSTGRRRRR